MVKLCGMTVLLLAVIITVDISASPVVSDCGKPADVIFVIDTSSSIWPKDFNKYVLTFVQNVVKIFNVGPHQSQTRVGAVTFSNDVKLEFNLNSYQNKDDVLNAISRIKFRGGNTYTDKAMKYVTENMFDEAKGSRPEVAHIIVVLTDGKSSNNARTIIESENARQKGYAIFAIGVGEAEDTELAQIASLPESQFKFKVTDFAALDGIKIELALKACEVSLPSPPPPTTTTTTTTTPAPLADECGGRPADIFFILDSSSSIWKVDFDKRVLGFVRDMVSNFDIGQEMTRVGVMTFSDSPRLVIGLNSFSNKQDLLKAISPQNVRYILGGTNTAEALHDVRKNGFHESITREGVVKIAVVITDGQSWNEKRTIKEAELLKESGVIIYAIGIGKGVKKEELEALANHPKEDFVFSVDGFNALSEIRDVLAVKACGHDLQSDQPVCGSGPTDITFAFDASTLTVKNKHHILDQLTDVTKRLASLEGDIRIGVTSGECPPSMDFPQSKPDDASLRVRSIKDNIRSNLLGIIKQWRYKMVGDLMSSSEPWLSKYNQGSTSPLSDSKKGLVLLMNKENIPEFNDISEEVLLLIDSGVDVMVVADNSINKKAVDKWVELIGHRRVLSDVDPGSDYSGYVMEFICSL